MVAGLLYVVCDCLLFGVYNVSFVVPVCCLLSVICWLRFAGGCSLFGELFGVVCGLVDWLLRGVSYVLFVVRGCCVLSCIGCWLLSVRVVQSLFLVVGYG